jgi:hypothetical protein
MWVLQIGHPEKRIVEGMTHFYDANVAGMMKMSDSMKTSEVMKTSDTMKVTDAMKASDAMKATDKLMKAH